MEGKIIVVKRKGKTNANKKGKKDGGGEGGMIDEKEMEQKNDHSN